MKHYKSGIEITNPSRDQAEKDKRDKEIKKNIRFCYEIFLLLVFSCALIGMAFGVVYLRDKKIRKDHEQRRAMFEGLSKSYGNRYQDYWMMPETSNPILVPVPVMDNPAKD